VQGGGCIQTLKQWSGRYMAPIDGTGTTVKQQNKGETYLTVTAKHATIADMHCTKFNLEDLKRTS
jgi:hypothetical protein